LGWRLPGTARVQIGVVLALIAALVIVDLAMAGESWVPLSRRLLGWGAYPLACGLVLSTVVVLVGDRLHWDLGWESLVGLEIALVALLGITHRWDEAGRALAWAEQGKGGGLVGWAISSLLESTVGALLGRVILLIFTGVGVWAAWYWAPVEWQWWIKQRASQVLGRLGMDAPEDESVLDATTLAQDLEGREQQELLASRPTAKRAARRSSSTRKSRKSKKTRSAEWVRDARLPDLALLHADRRAEFGDANADYRAEIIEQTLGEFGVPVRVIDVKQGPAVTRFGVQPQTVTRRRSDGTLYDRKVSVKRIVALSNDLALALAASPLRIEAPVPGQPYVGIEVPNEKVSLVALRGVMESADFHRLAVKSSLAIALGRDVSGEPLVGDLGQMPHLLIAGATGSGKSVCINSIVTCLLLNNTPDTLRLLLMDPKRVELPAYNGIPHLLSPVVLELQQAVGALTWLSLQMDERYRQFHAVQARNVEGYNRVARRRANLEPLPHIVLVIDELADMMMAAADDVERYICRLAQMARATGIHLVIATQRPSVDVVTGLIKANFPARVAFSVTSQVDSRVVLDQAGAEQLLGRGDMLFMSPDSAGLTRAQGCFVSDREIAAVVRHWRKQDSQQPSGGGELPWQSLLESAAHGDELYAQAVELVQRQKRASTSSLQRQLRIGYPRAARLMGLLEEEGLVGPDEGGGRGREVLLSRGGRSRLTMDCCLRASGAQRN